MADRKVIINDRIMEIIKEDSGVTADGNLYGAAREVAEPTPAGGNLGNMSPVPSGNVEASLSTNVFMRTPGDVGAARFGWGDSSGYRGKAAAHLIDHTYLLNAETVDSQGPQKPKLLPLDNGKMICFWVKDVTGDFNYKVWDPTTGWGAEQTQTASTVAPLKGITAIQFPDTKQIAVFVVEVLGADTMKMTRWTSGQDTISFNQAPTEIRHISSTTYLFQGLDAEVLPNGNITLLAQFFGTKVATEENGLQGAFSTDRGATWSDWSTAGDIGVIDSAITDAVAGFTTHPSSNGKGVPRIKRLKNGSFLAVAPGTTGILDPIVTNFTTFDNPAIRLLISDDGVSWADALRMTRVLDTDVGGNKSFAVCMFPDGAWEASIAVGDDGLPRIYIVQHGDANSKSLTTTNYVDDVALLTLTKSDITVKDVSPLLPQGAGNNAIVVSDMFDVDLTSTGITVLNPDLSTTTKYSWVRKVDNSNWETLSARRINAWSPGVTTGGSGDLDVAPTPVGAIHIDAANHRGAIWQALTAERDTSNEFNLTVLRGNSWTSLQEMPPEVDNSADNLIGNVYDYTYVPILKPATLDGNWTETIGAGGAINLDDTADHGLEITDTTGATNVSRTGTIFDTGPLVVRAVLKPTLGGSASSDEIALRIQRGDGSANNTHLSVRFLSGAGGQVKGRDIVAGSDLGSAGADIANGVEVVVAYSDFDNLDGIWIRELPSTSLDPEDRNLWIQIQGAATLSTQAGNVNTMEFGHFTTVATKRSVWYAVQWKSAALATLYRVYDFSLATGNPWDAATPVFHEFNDDFAQYGKQIHDDGIRHGTRAPAATSTPTYIKKGVNVSWRGSAGEHGDDWGISTKISYDADKIVSTPVRDYWRSSDDATDTGLVLTATNSYFDPATIALFGINAHSFRVEFNNSNSWGSPAVSMTCDTAGGADADRHYYHRTNSGDTTFVAEGKQLRLTGTVTPEPFTPGQFKSNERVSWYMYSNAADETYKIIDNDNTRLFFDSALDGAVDDGGAYIAIFPDKIAIDLLGGVLSKGIGDTQGYTHMRIFFPTQNVAEDYFKLGLVIAGRVHSLTDPHPEWGWTRTVNPSVVKLSTPFGHSENILQATARNSWSVGFNALVGRADRTDTTSDPQNAAGWARWVDFLEKSDWGVKAVALLPDYNNHLDSAAFGNRSLEVFPVIINLPATLTHVAYENCRANSGSIVDVLNLSGITFEEIL